jgi:hypothetical protein
MRGVVIWLSGAALAFFLTAGAFLLLANIATIPVVELELNADQLDALRPEPDQNLDLTVRDKGGTPLSDVNVTLKVSSENTALSVSRFYRHMVEKVPAKGAANVPFGFDLSEPEQRVTGRPASEPAREILEIKATTPDGISTIKTVILPP